MSETKMPVAEVEVVGGNDDERFSYELAFHVLPTVAEGEVSAVFNKIKAVITNAGGELFAEEAPERFDLAYEIVKHLEGKNRKFASAYFGWVRFKSEPSAVAGITEEVEADTNVLRHILIKLTKAEEQNPFSFHEVLKSEKMVTTVGDSEVTPDSTATKKKDDVTKEEEVDEVNDKEAEKALEEKDV